MWGYENAVPLARDRRKNPNTETPRIDRPNGTSDSQENGFDEALLPERLQRVMLAIMLGHHPQTRGPAVHGVELVVVWEPLSHYTTYKD